MQTKLTIFKVSICFLVSLINCFDLARWWWAEAMPFFAYLAKEGRKRTTKQMVLIIQFLVNGGNNPPFTFLSGMPSSTKPLPSFVGHS